MTDRPLTETVPFDPPPITTTAGASTPQPASGAAPGARSPLSPEDTKRRIQELQEEIATLERDAAFVPYPKMLFKPPTLPSWTPPVDTRVVQSPDEEETAKGEGWTESLEEAQQASRTAAATLGPSDAPPDVEAAARRQDEEARRQEALLTGPARG